MIARKWDFKKHEYNSYELPEGASCYEVDLERKVACGSCGKPMIFGNGYTSRQIHTVHGMGYCVCDKCYEKEWQLDRAERKEREYE